jgi:pimeloyl-ACP methyl ester carboxylesterase
VVLVGRCFLLSSLSLSPFLSLSINNSCFFCWCRYDVWIGNNRGCPIDHATSPLLCPTSSARIEGHRTLKPSSAEYWNWSIDELGLYDFTALLEHVVQKTGSTGGVHYVGHSQGTSQAFIGVCAEGEARRQRVKELLKSFTALAQVSCCSGDQTAPSQLELCLWMMP